MREIRQLQLCPEGLIALDEDGYAWIGYIRSPEWLSAPDTDDAGSILVDWVPFQALPDEPPGLDTRTWLDRVEDRLRKDAEARDALRERFDTLPPIKTEQ